MKRSFPEAFIWGAATSSYQIEGAARQDGRSPSIWDAFADRSGTIKDGTTGAVACDHYHRYPADIGLMAEIGLQAYRFSTSWSRVMPDGQHANTAGLDFYDRLVDGLLEAGIDPVVTLYHWDMPEALQTAFGGWSSRRVVDAFALYTDVVSKRLGDRVGTWSTINEPWCVAFLGHVLGVHAPGVRSWPKGLAAAHHTLLAHGNAVPIIRANSPGAEVGITLNLAHVDPASGSEHDADAARYEDGAFNRWYLDPIFRGGYPEDMVADHQRLGRLPAGRLPFVEAGDLDTIGVETDFLGINYYNRIIARADVDSALNAPRVIPEPDPAHLTDIGWEVHADGLRDVLVRVHRDYTQLPLFVHENGAAINTGPDPDTGEVHDERRIAYLRDHFAAAHQALEQGVPLRGFFVWSLMDNFEWAWGNSMRFGLIWVDYETQARTLKDSAHWYHGVIATNAVDADQPPLEVAS